MKNKLSAKAHRSAAGQSRAKNRNVPLQSSDSAVVAIDYRLEEPCPELGIGPHNACLLGMAYQLPGHEVEHVTRGREIDQTLRSFGTCRRVYVNALQARLIEMREGLPLASSFDDVSTMVKLLDGSCPEEPSTRGKTGASRTFSRGTGSRRPSAVQVSSETIMNNVESAFRLYLGSDLPRLVEQHGLGTVYRAEIAVIDPTATMMLAGTKIDTHLLERLAIRLSKTSGEDRRRGAVENFADRLRRAVDPTTGRVHCTLDPLGTATGRFTCRNLELQAVPAELRRVFVADDGYVLLEADFSQIELRVLAHFSNEPLLLAAYTGDDNEVDIHRRTAALALGIDESDVNQQQRNDVGKAINFGIVFGQTEYGLAGKLGIGVQEAASFIEAFFVGYPAVRQWIKSVRRETQRRGAVETLYGRRRRLADATCADDRLRERAFRQSVNTIIQGTAADINKMALARLHKALPDDCHLLLTVHDSVLMEVPKRRAKRLAALVRQVMEEPPPKFDVPLVVSVNYGPSWGRSR